MGASESILVINAVLSGGRGDTFEILSDKGEPIVAVVDFGVAKDAQLLNLLDDLSE